MSSFTSTIQDTAKEASSRIADSAKAASGVASGAAKVAGKKVTNGYGQALDFVLTGAKLIPSVTAALGLLGLQKKKSNVLGNSLMFGAGIMLGAGAGMILAPKSGAELRNTILGYLKGTPLEGAADKVAHKAEAVQHVVTDKVDSLKNDLKAATHNGSRTVS